MKTKCTPCLKGLTVFLVVVLVLSTGIVRAQLPNCTSGNIMYAVFNNVAGSATADSSEIRSVDVATGTVGPLMGGKRYWISKAIGSDVFYGTAALAVDMITNRFYVMTQMSSSATGVKDIITINPVNGTQTVIASTPNNGGSSLRNFHFVKLAIAPNGYGYALGVHADNSADATQFNPLVRFTTCGASPSAGCGTITLLGYLQSGGIMDKWQLFNGDIAFDVNGNLYFATAAYANSKYTDARLFRINAADIPASAGSGTIPMTFMADYNSLDSTVINGIGLDGNGNMYITTRRFFPTQTATPPPTAVSELYGSFAPGSVTYISGFSVPTPNFSVADLASCYFPATILGLNKLQLQYKYENSNVNLKWVMESAAPPTSFDVQRSDDGTNFSTIATVPYTDKQTTYSYADQQSGFGKTKFYRIRANMSAATRSYTNVVNVNFGMKAHLLAEVSPNPFTSYAKVDMWLKSAGTVSVRILDQSGRMVYNKQLAGRAGENPFRLEGLGGLNAGVYVVEMRVQDEVMRSKIIKQ